MKKRRLAALLLAAVMALTACSGKGGGATETTAGQTLEETTAAQPGEAETSAAETSEAGASEAETTAAGGQEKHEYKLPDYAFTLENFPRMDGSTATIPVGRELAKLLIGADDAQAANLSSFNRTTQSYRNLKNGLTDILIVSQPNAAVFKEMEEVGFEYETEDIATDALIFVVNESNPVDNLTTDQIRDIYSGKITNWKDVGGNDEPIEAFQRNEGAGSQALMVKLVMGDTEFMEAPTGYVIGSMGDLMKAVKSYDNSANAIGYSVYYYANDMKMAEGLKIISVDGVKPEADTIRSGEYPHLNAYYCVIPKNPSTSTEQEKARAEGARAIYEWLVTDDGQQMLADLGYVSVKNVASGEPSSLPEAKYTRLHEEPMNELEPRDDYGRIYPYTGTALYSNYESGSYLEGYMKGFFDENGRLVTDPVYSDISRLTYYRSSDSMPRDLPIWVMSTVVEDEEKKAEADTSSDYAGEYASSVSRFTSLDGSFVSDEHNYIVGRENGVLCFDSYDTPDFVLYDFKGEKILDLQMLIDANADDFKDKLASLYAGGLDYSEGCYVLGLSDGYYFVDEKTLKPVYGPYSYADVFHDGLAQVSYDLKDGYETNYINTSGEEQLPSGLGSTQILADGKHIGAMQTGDGDDFYIFEIGSGSKEPVFEVDDLSYMFTSLQYGVAVAPKSYGENSNGFDIYDFDGKLLFSDETGRYQYDTMHPIVYVGGTPDGEDDHVLTDEETAKTENHGIWATNILTGKKAFFENISSLYSFYGMDYTPDIPYMTGNGYDPVTYDVTRAIVIDEDLNVVDESKGYFYSQSDESMTKFYMVKDTPDDGKMVYHDAQDYDKVICTWTESGTICDDIYIVNTENACEVYNFETGELVFCYPRIGSLED